MILKHDDKMYMLFDVTEHNTFHPEYVHEPNFKSQRWSSKGNHVMSILQVLLKIPGGMYMQLPSLETTTFVWNVPSNFSSALFKRNQFKNEEVF